MKNISAKGRRLTGLFFLGWVFWNFPVISLFDMNMAILGFPILFLYIFSVWAMLIVFIAILTRKRTKSLFRNFPGRPK